MAGNCERSDAVEKVELSVISDDPEIPSSRNEVQLQEADPRNEQSKLPEQADKPDGSESEDEHEDIDDSSDPDQHQKIEKELDDALRKGDFDDINQKVTPKTLASCKSNTLLKTFQVNKALRDLAHDENSERDDVEMLEKSIDEFTSALMDPLKADPDTRKTFQSCFDYVIDKAIDTEQKKFISHPVVYNLLNTTWYRSFSSTRKISWRSPGRWGYFFLNLWTVFDIVLFPFLFAIFFVVHLIKQVLRKRRETEMCFVLTLDKDKPKKEFDLIKETMSYIVQKYGYQSASYCVILRKNNELIGDINFEERCSCEATLQKRIAELEQPSSPALLFKDLDDVCSAFRAPNVRKKAKKVVVLFLNYTLDMSMEKTEKLQDLVEDIKDMQVNIVPVGIGEDAKLSELKKMATKDGTALHFGEYESPETLGTAVIQGIEGKDIYEKYKDYFTTPYFVFFRDTLSYITLLVLHFALCLSPSTVSFSRLEQVILVFFVGRIVMEMEQFISAKKNAVKARKVKRNSVGCTPQECSPEDPQEINEAGNDSLLPKTFIGYFSDRWNVLDFITLVLYLITFVLRMTTLRISTDVSGNRLLVVSEYFYGFIAMFLTIRAFGQVIERLRKMGTIQIALFFIIADVLAIFWQFLAMILAFALPMTKIYIAEEAYTSGRDSADSFISRVCSESGIICWWNIATHLSWSLLGLADQDWLDSVDVPSVFLVRLLYGFFLIMAVVLLVNMMIALLSNTYQQVQDNSLHEWSFKRAIIVRTYSKNNPIPVPFNILSVPLMVLWNIFLGSPCCTSFDTPGLDEAGRSRTLDKLVKKLERRYFEKYGYEFPLTEERKMDHLVRQNEGGRKMTNQIVREIFQTYGNKAKKLAFGRRAWRNSPGIAVDGCLLTYLGPDFCKKCKDGKPNNIHSAKFNSPFTEETPRFEVLIQGTGERRIIALGVVNKSFDCHKMPGLSIGTVGYHVDDGKIFEGGCSEVGREIEGAMAYRGDLIACEVDFKEVPDGKISVLFSLNGEEVGRSSMKYTSGQTLYPIVSMGFPGIKVLAKMCYRDRFSRVTTEDIQKEIKILQDNFQDQLADLKRLLLDLRKK
ncbi:uncharacterized protein [Pocillopora verrucosa]|uniref:uncharacterized protein n=1 Tax=Pocillopora verrucosa TaxID=203993 RepID=UPI00333EFD62